MEDRGVRARPNDGAGADHVIVLPVNPVLGSDRWVAEKLAESGEGIDCGKFVDAGVGDPGYRSLRFARIERRFIGERFRRNFGGDGAVVAHAHHAVVRYAADLRARHIPFFKNLAHDLFFAALRDDQHSFLRFAQQNFVGRHARLALRHFRQIDFHAGAAAARGLASRAGESGRAHVLNAGDGIGREQFEAGFEQQFFFEWIADLDCRAIFARFFGQLARGERRAGKPSRPVSAPT